MKNIRRFLILLIAVSAMMCVTAFAADNTIATIDQLGEGTNATIKDNNVSFELNHSGAPDGMYMVFVLKEELGSVLPTASDILYVNQTTNSGAGITFDNVYPSEIEADESYIYLSGTGFDKLTKVGRVVPNKPLGFTVSGKVESYNPNNAVTVTLKQGDATMYSAIIAAGSGSGQLTQDFELTNVAVGTYDLVVSKAAHLDYTVTGVNVESGNLALSDIITMLVGDINQDKLIDVTDLNIVWNEANYNLDLSSAENALTDLNGDGLVDVTDLNIVWNEANYNKGVADCMKPY